MLLHLEYGLHAITTENGRMRSNTVKEKSWKAMEKSFSRENMKITTLSVKVFLFCLYTLSAFFIFFTTAINYYFYPPPPPSLVDCEKKIVPVCVRGCVVCVVRG